MAFVKFGLGGFGETDVAVAGTCNIGAAPTRRVRFTAGTGPVTSFGAGTNRRRICRSAVVFTLAHSASLSLPTSDDIFVAVGDTWDADSDAGGDWIVSNYQRRTGLPLVVMASYTVGTLPSASPAGKIIYVSNETGGAVPAFSDGTNWRRFTDRAIVA